MFIVSISFYLQQSLGLGQVVCDWVLATNYCRNIFLLCSFFPLWFSPEFEFGTNCWLQVQLLRNKNIGCGENNPTTSSSQPGGWSREGLPELLTIVQDVRKATEIFQKRLPYDVRCRKSFLCGMRVIRPQIEHSYCGLIFFFTNLDQGDLPRL